MANSRTISLIGRGSLVNSLSSIFEFQALNDEPQIVTGIPEFMAAEVLDDNSLNAVEDHDNNEYLLDAEKMGLLKGSDMSKIRQMTNGFERKTGSVVETLALDSSDDSISFLLRSVNSWGKAFATNPTAAQEKDVIEQTLKNSNITGHKNLCFYVDSKLFGFALYHTVHNKTAIVSHLKSSYEYEHSSYFMIHKLATILLNQDVERINIEQDLGIPGLRSFKQRLRPVDMLRKFNITPTEQ